MSAFCFNTSLFFYNFVDFYTFMFDRSFSVTKIRA